MLISKLSIIWSRRVKPNRCSVKKVPPKLKFLINKRKVSHITELNDLKILASTWMMILLFHYKLQDHIACWKRMHLLKILLQKHSIQRSPLAGLESQGIQLYSWHIWNLVIAETIKNVFVHLIPNHSQLINLMRIPLLHPKTNKNHNIH